MQVLEEVPQRKLRVTFPYKDDKAVKEFEVEKDFTKIHEAMVKLGGEIKQLAIEADCNFCRSKRL